MSTFHMPSLHGGHSGAGAIILAHVSTTTSTEETITIPVDDRVSGYLALLIQYSYQSGSPPTLVTPTGFTSIHDVAGSTSRGEICMKLLDGTETVLTGMTGATADNKHLFIFESTGGAITTLSSHDLAQQETSGTPNEQTPDPSAETDPCIVYGATHASSTGEFTVASPAFDGTTSISKGQAGYKIYNTGHAGHAIDADDNGNRNILMSGYIKTV